MRRFRILFYLFTVLPLAIGAIWLTPAQAAVAPALTSLGQIRAGLAAPAEIDLDAEGNLFVADPGQGAVLKIDPYGKVARKFEAAVSGRGLAVSPDGMRIYVAGEDSVAVLEGVSGEVVASLGKGVGEFKVTGPIDVDSHGFVFVADCGTLQVKVYDPAGRFQYAFGGLGTTAGKFRVISALQIHADQVYIADPSYKVSKVQVFGLDGTLVRSISTLNGIGSTPIAALEGVIFDNAGRGYFLDFYGSKIRVLGLPGQYLSAFGPTIATGKLGLVNDFAFDPVTGRLFFVCDNQRIDIVGVDGGANPVPRNNPPSRPVLQSPIAGSIVATAQPALTFAGAADPDGDSLHYQVRLLLDGKEVDGKFAVAESAGVARATIGIPLQENAAYSWQVQASDGTDVSGWTAVETFHVNAVQEAPAPPVPTSPLEGEQRTGGGLLQWQAATDPDPADVVTYRVEIAADSSFVADLQKTDSPVTEAALSDLSGYLDLRPGKTYFWRVAAIDKQGAETLSEKVGSFTLNATDLVVESNMPGVDIYAGGNLAYPGRFLGQAPLRLRDFPAGVETLVLERAGFEPLAASLRIEEGKENSLYGELKPAIAPGGFKLQPLLGDESSASIGEGGAPFVLDYDRDGLVDLLVAGANGTLAWIKGELKNNGDLRFPTATRLNLDLPTAAVPFAADWNNDGRKDLLIGGQDGTIQLYLNTGSEEAPVFAEGKYLTSAGTPINVTEQAAPFVADLDGDRRKDLVVGSGSGSVYLYPNVGSDAEPDLGAPAVLIQAAGPVYPFLVDWDADGTRDLLLSAGDGLHLYGRQADQSFQKVQTLAVAPGNGKGKGEGPLGVAPRLFVCDLDGRNGKDIVFGNASLVKLAAGESEATAAAFLKALEEKVAQIGELSAAAGIDADGFVAAIVPLLRKGEWAAAERLTEDFAAKVPTGAGLGNSLSEFRRLLD